MYDYITKELPALLSKEFPNLDVAKAAITGHSMGGHGALTIGLKNPTLYKSISAFAPICNPTKVPWGIKGGNESTGVYSVIQIQYQWPCARHESALNTFPASM